MNKNNTSIFLSRSIPNKEYGKNMKICLIVTVYQNRYDKLATYLGSDECKLDNFDIYFLSQDNDIYKDYEKYCKKGNMKVITCNAKSIQEKRKYGYHFAIDNGYDILIWTDDDISPRCNYIDFITKTESKYSNKVMHDNIDILYNRLIEIMEEHPEAGMVTAFRPGLLGILQNTQKEYFNKFTHPSQLIVINLNNIKNTIDYNDSELYMEDQCFYIDMLTNGYPIYTAGDVTFNCLSAYNWDKNTSLVYSNENGGKYKRDKQLIRHFIKYGGNLRLNKKGLLTAYIKYSKYYNYKDLPIPYSKEFDMDLMNLCKSREVDNILVDKVYDYLHAMKACT